MRIAHFLLVAAIGLLAVAGRAQLSGAEPADVQSGQTLPPRLVLAWGRKGEGAGEFNEPGGIAFGPDGTIYVADQSNHRVQQFTPEGRFLAQWGGHGSEPGQFGGKSPDLGAFEAGARLPHFGPRDDPDAVPMEWLRKHQR